MIAGWWGVTQRNERQVTLAAWRSLGSWLAVSEPWPPGVSAGRRGRIAAAHSLVECGIIARRLSIVKLQAVELEAQGSGKPKVAAAAARLGTSSRSGPTGATCPLRRETGSWRVTARMDGICFVSIRSYWSTAAGKPEDEAAGGGSGWEH